MTTPYEYHNDKLGLKISHIVSDKCNSEYSLNLMAYNTFAQRKLRGKHKNEFTELRRGCLNNSEPLVTWESVPQYIKDLVVEKFGHPKEASKLSLLEQNYVRDAKAFDFYSAYKKSNGEFLTDKFIQEYTANASVLNAMHAVLTDKIGLRKALGGKTTGLHADMVRVIYSYKDKWEHTLPNSERLIRFYYKPYIKDGYEALISGKIDNDNSRKVDSFIVKFLNTLFAGQSHKPTMTEVAQQYKAFRGGYIEDIINSTTGEVYDYKDKRFKDLSHSTITNYLREWENKIGTYAKRGDNIRTVQLFKPSHRFQQTMYAGSIISVDDRQPPFYYNSDKDRVWFYKGIDLASGCWIAWVHGSSKEGLILDFYREIVRNYHEWGFNLPYELECEMHLNSAFTDTFLKEGAMFSKVKMEANNPRGKRIERHFGHLRHEAERRLEGWVARPFAKLESQQKANEDYSGKIKVIPYENIVENVNHVLVSENNSPHRERKDLTCWEHFCSMQHPELRPTNYRGFLHFLGYKTKTSCNVGMIRLNNGEYWLGENGKVAAGPNLINMMKQVEGEELDIYWLDTHEGSMIKALVYLRNTDQYVCEAVPIPSYSRASLERTDEDERNKDIQDKYVSTINAFMRSQKRDIDKVQIIGMPTKVMNNKFRLPGTKQTEIVETQDAEILDNTDFEDIEIVARETTIDNNINNRW